MRQRSTRNPGEIRALTGLRGIAAVWVMVYHTIATSHPANIVRILINHGYLSVDLFFMLSGYVLALNYGPLFRGVITRASITYFLRRRLARTYPLYLATTLAVLALVGSGLVTLGVPNAPVCGAQALLPNLLLIQGWGTHFCNVNGPGWSISAEWGAYLLFPLLVRLIVFNSPRTAGTAVVVSAATLVILSALPTSLLVEHGYRLGPLNVSNTVTLAPMARCLAEFTLGLAAFRLSRGKSLVWLTDRNWPGILVSLVVLALLCLRDSDLFVVMLFALLIISLTSDRGIVAATLGCTLFYFLGVISYSIYLTHYPILLLVERVFAILPQAYQTYPTDLAAWITTIAIATTTYYVIERPSRRALSQGLALSLKSRLRNPT